MFTLAQIQQMVAATVKAVDPERIVLFGSYARGDARAGSDIDLLVVKGSGARRGRWGDIRAIRHALRPFRGPKDILVFSDGEVARLRESRVHVIGTAMREGKVLYEHRT